MTEGPMNKTNNKYDLEGRTYQFAKDVALFCKELPLNLTNKEYISQVIRASGSIGSNYIEANEALSKKDFVMRAKICRKEAKESIYWLKLIMDTNPQGSREGGLSLEAEATELKKIFSSIITKSS
jgi:four helix bundle protein